MKTFEGWRAVGRAMRWARKQDSIERRVIVEPEGLREMSWSRSEHCVAVQQTGGDQLGMWIALDSGGRIDADDLSAPEMLRVLAALDLIPAELAEVAE